METRDGAGWVDCMRSRSAESKRSCNRWAIGRAGEEQSIAGESFFPGEAMNYSFSLHAFCTSARNEIETHLV